MHFVLGIGFFLPCRWVYITCPSWSGCNYHNVFFCFCYLSSTSHKLENLLELGGRINAVLAILITNESMFLCSRSDKNVLYSVKLNFLMRRFASFTAVAALLLTWFWYELLIWYMQFNFRAKLHNSLHEVLTTKIWITQYVCPSTFSIMRRYASALSSV